ncbi:hypothetical protein ACI799_01540 [Blastococcus sp. SYSU DS0753]
MNSNRLLDALRAADTGNAVPARSRCHTHLSREPLVITAYHLANEPGAPVGLLYGTDRDHPHVVAFGNPLNRDLRFAGLAEVARDVIGYLTRFGATTTRTYTPTRGPNAGQTRTTVLAVDTPQIVTPNSGTATWLGEVLGRSLRYLKPAEQNVDPLLPALGAYLTVFSQRSHDPLSHLLVVATQLLSEHWTTGQLSGETENLHALLGWIDPMAGETGRTSAAAVERGFLPVGPEPDAAFDPLLYPAIDAWRAGVAAGTDPVAASAQMREAIVTALLPGYQATFDALDVARALPPAAHTAARHEGDRQAWARLHGDVTGGTARFRRLLDALSGARLLQNNEKAVAEYARQTALDDRCVVDELIADGEATSGTVVAVDLSHRVGRRYRPRLQMQPDVGYLRAPGARLHVTGRPRMTADVVAVDPVTGIVTVELAGGMGNGQPAPSAVPAPGDLIELTPYGPEEFYPQTLPSALPWTHQLPAPVADPTAGAAGPAIPTPVDVDALPPAARPLATVTPLPIAD